MEIKGLSYSAISLSMYVVLKSTYVDHSDYVPGFYIHVRRHEESYIAEEEKQQENRSIPPDPQKNSYAPLQLGLIQRGTRTYSSTKPSLHKGDRRRSLRGRSPLTRGATIPKGILTRSPTWLLPIAPAWARLRIFVDK